MREDRGYDPDVGDVEKSRQQQIILKLIERSGYAEGREEKSWKDWALGIMSVLVTLGIPATIFQLSDLKSDTKVLIEIQKQDSARIEKLENRVYRGGSPP